MARHAASQIACLRMMCRSFVWPPTWMTWMTCTRDAPRRPQKVALSLLQVLLRIQSCPRRTVLHGTMCSKQAMLAFRAKCCNGLACSTCGLRKHVLLQHRLASPRHVWNIRHSNFEAVNRGLVLHGDTGLSIGIHGNILPPFSRMCVRIGPFGRHDHRFMVRLFSHRGCIGSCIHHALAYLRPASLLGSVCVSLHPVAGVAPCARRREGVAPILSSPQYFSLRCDF